MLQLRQYQSEAVQAVFDYWATGGGNPLIVIPTGGGKSLIIATIVRRLIENWPSMRIGVVTHTKELIAQNYAELIRIWPEAPAGIYSAGLNRRDTRSKILFCGIQSVAKKVKQIGALDVLIVDEAHLIPRSSDTLYGRFIEDLKTETPDMRILGATATPFRLDTGRLESGDSAMFDAIAYEANVSDLIRQGYLSPLISKATAASIDVSNVAKRGGEFIPAALEGAVDQDWITKAAVAETVGYGADRRAWLIFCVSVKHAENVRDEVRRHGFSCEAVSGDMPAADRSRVIEAFRRGELRCLTSVSVLTTGFNVPQVDLVSLMRPTLSTGLFIQQVGRAFRLAPGKENAIVLDFAGNVRRHGPVDIATVGDREKASNVGTEKVSEGDVRAKCCPSCETLVGLRDLTCWHCGHEWPKPEPEPKHQPVAEAVPILSTERTKPVGRHVYSWEPRRHMKLGSPDSVRLMYRCGLQCIFEWICPEHTGFARQKFETWWKQHGGGVPPRTVQETLDRWAELTMPQTIFTRLNGRYDEITGRSFHAVAQAAE
jgi:DNA repair protein RadD